MGITYTHKVAAVWFNVNYLYMIFFLEYIIYLIGIESDVFSFCMIIFITRVLFFLTTTRSCLFKVNFPR